MFSPCLSTTSRPISLRRLSTSPLFLISSSQHAVRCNQDTISAVHRPPPPPPPPPPHNPLSQLHPTCSTRVLSSSATTKPLHALSITSGSSPPISIHNTLITAYAASAELSTARELFDRMPQRNAASYNSIIAAYSQSSYVDEAWAMLSRMMASDLRPTPFTFGGILSSPSFDVLRGLQLHPLIMKTGMLHADPFSGTALLGFLGRRGRLGDAVKVFEEMPVPTVVSWNSIISAFAQQGFPDDSMFLFRELLRTDVGQSEYSFLSVLSAFRSSDSSQYVEQMHGLAIKASMDSYLMVANALLNGYSNCFGAYVAERLFRGLPIRDVISWNTMIAAFAKGNMPERALELLSRMSLEGFLPNETTFASVLSACTNLNAREYGEVIHAKIIKQNVELGVFVGSSLVDFYAKCKCLDDALIMFNEIPEKSVVAWNALISGCSNESSSASIFLLREMMRLGFRPNEYSFSAGLKWASASDLWQLHSLVIRMGYDSSEYVSSAIIASYAAHGVISDALACGAASVSPLDVVSTNVIAGIYNRIGEYQEAQEVISQLHDLDTVSWNILFTACGRNGDYTEAFQLFKRMQTSGCKFDKYTAMSLLSICSKINSLDLGSLLHGLIIKTNSRCLDVFVHNVLLDMYAKCGSLESSLRVFQEMDERNLISWTAMISGLGLHGRTDEAFERFKQMELEGFKPDQVTFIAILSACRHGGYVEEGMMLFRCMTTVYGVEPEMDHYICIVDLLCRYGYLGDAKVVISGMPFQPNAAIWRTFLQGCKRYGNIHFKERNDFLGDLL